MSFMDGPAAPRSSCSAVVMASSLPDCASVFAEQDIEAPLQPCHRPLPRIPTVASPLARGYP
jgi:hypothetical protein